MQIKERDCEETEDCVIYKRGKVYWFEFRFKGQRIQQSTHQRNAVKARDLESKCRTRLIDGEAGIKERKNVPTLEAFKPIFMEWVRIGEGQRAHAGVLRNLLPEACATTKPWPKPRWIRSTRQ
jgi:hypothetical protein